MSDKTSNLDFPMLQYLIERAKVGSPLNTNTDRLENGPGVSRATYRPSITSERAGSLGQGIEDQFDPNQQQGWRGDNGLGVSLQQIFEYLKRNPKDKGTTLRKPDYK